MIRPVALLLDALTDAAISGFDGEPQMTPSGPYVAVWDDTGLRQPDVYGGGARNNLVTFRLMCVARTRDGLDHLLHQVTAALTGRRLAGRESSPLTEQYASPALTGGPEGDKRHTKTVTYQTLLPRPSPTPPPMEEPQP